MQGIAGVVGGVITSFGGGNFASPLIVSATEAASDHDMSE